MAKKLSPAMYQMLQVFASGAKAVSGGFDSGYYLFRGQPEGVSTYVDNRTFKALQSRRFVTRRAELEDGPAWVISDAGRKALLECEPPVYAPKVPEGAETTLYCMIVYRQSSSREPQRSESVRVMSVQVIDTGERYYTLDGKPSLILGNHRSASVDAVQPHYSLLRYDADFVRVGTHLPTLLSEARAYAQGANATHLRKARYYEDMLSVLDAMIKEQG